MTPYNALEKYFGYTEFRPGQLEIINSILSGVNVLAVLPTGAGKSLCYQIPALINKGYSLVISPLIALMKDQVDSINKKEQIAAYINSTLDFREEQKVLSQLHSGKLKILFAAPEKLSSVKFIEQLKFNPPEYIFVDEAHCISEWGMDFRPSYRKLKEVTELWNIKKISAFTATATPDVRQDIIEQLGMTEPRIFVRGFERDNLSLNVIRTNKKKEYVFKLLNEAGTPAIIYCSTRKAVESVYKFLRSASFKVTYYHAGLNSELRRLVQDDFINGNFDVICATNAFGMGIDKSDIRTIIHYNVPGSIENYYQEIGRAGRDGNESNTYLLFDEKDVAIQEHFIESNIPSKDEVLTVYDGLFNYSGIALGQKPENEIPFDNKLTDFFKLKNIDKSVLNSSLEILRDSGIIEITKNRSLKPRVRSLLSTEDLRKYFSSIASAAQKNLLLPLIKIYGSGLFLSGIKIDPETIAKQADMPEARVLELLQNLNDSGIIELSIPTSLNNIKVLQTRGKTKYIELNFDNIERKVTHSKEKLQAMLDFVYSEKCRFNFILEYFGQKGKKYECGKCDNCTDKQHSSDSNEFIANAILRTLHENRLNLRTHRIIKILQGRARSTDERKLSTFGVCKHYSADEIKNTLSYLSAKGMVEKYDDLYSLSEKGKEEFTNDSIDDNADYDFERKLKLFNKLREVRKAVAQKFTQQERVICSDEVLRNIAEKEPISPAQLMSIQGVSQNLFFKAGREIIEEIKNFREKEKASEKQEDIPENLLSIDKLINKGYKLEEIVSLTKLPESVVSVQIESLIMLKPDTPINKLMNSKTIDLIKSKIITGFESLKELKASLPPEINYAMIRIVAAKVKADKN